MTATSTFEQGLADAIAASKAIRDRRIDQITLSLQTANPSTSWDDLQAPLQQALLDAGLQAYAQTRHGEALTWAH